MTIASVMRPLVWTEPQPAPLPSPERGPINLVLIGGDHPRHLYFLNAVANHPAVTLRASIIQRREKMLPPVPEGTSQHDRELWARHFSARDAKEAEYFGQQERRFEAREVGSAEELEGEAVRDWLWYENYFPDLVLIFGCGMIGPRMMRQLPTQSINLHLGLSPRYRGAATLFWPFYMLEPNHAGATFHQIVSEPDAGPILHQSVPVLKPGDTIHDVACRAVIQATADMTRLLHTFREWKYRPQKNTGKCFLARDFQPGHLRTIYDVWQDRIVDAHLAGIITAREPRLYHANL